MNDLGDKPSLDAPPPYKAPAAEVYTTAQGITVWLVSRPGLPIVAMSLSVPSGSANDPPDKAGLAHITASMLDEGAGSRDALTLSSELNDLGADLGTDADLDGSRVTLTVLKKHLDKGMAIFADVVSKPTFDDSEWKRVTDLWRTGLERRADDPNDVARLARSAALYGPDTPYGHPSSGYVDSARAITLEDAKQFYQTAWRPDHAHLVVAGAITKAELDALLARHLGDWRKPDAPLLARIEAPAPQETRPRMILVDRADAPQAVVLVASPGVAAAAPDAPLLALVNTALGGSFTSRLNQNLREDKGWTYGARSAFLQTRGTGAFVAQAAVFTNVTAPALREMIGEIDGMAKRGLEDAELHKVRARDLTDLIETHETVDDLVGRLASLGILGLPSDHDAKASAERQQATKEQLNALAARYLDTSQATIIVVGPRAELMTQLRALDLGEPELWSPEGRPLADDKPKKK